MSVTSSLICVQGLATTVGPWAIPSSAVFVGFVRRYGGIDYKAQLGARQSSRADGSCALTLQPAGRQPTLLGSDHRSGNGHAGTLALDPRPSRPAGGFNRAATKPVTTPRPYFSSGVQRLNAEEVGCARCPVHDAARTAAYGAATSCLMHLLPSVKTSGKESGAVNHLASDFRPLALVAATSGSVCVAEFADTHAEIQRTHGYGTFYLEYQKLQQRHVPDRDPGAGRTHDQQRLDWLSDTSVQAASPPAAHPTATNGKGHGCIAESCWHICAGAGWHCRADSNGSSYQLDDSSRSPATACAAVRADCVQVVIHAAGHSRCGLIL